MKKVLILCTGNSCRSQMAHGFLQSFDKDLIVRSAGTKAAGKLNEGAVRAMAGVGIDISHHTSDPVEKYLGEECDYVITVCGGANEACPIFTGKVKHRLHIGFDDPSHAEGTPEFIENEFRRVRDEIKNRFYEFYSTDILSNENYFPSDSSIICFCSQITVSDIKNAIANGATNVQMVRDILDRHQTGDCFRKNPSGKCCGSNVVAVIHKYK